MAESKPTKLQMAKEIQYLIVAAQDMSAVMDLDPVIKTDYLIDLKNKTVTATHLQNVVANLQADIKRDASMIEPEDKFQPDTHKVLADLNVKVPRPSAKKEVVEDEGDDVMPTPSPPMEEEAEEAEEVVEKEKPIKKEKKPKPDKKLSLSKFVCYQICDNLKITVKEVADVAAENGYNSSFAVIQTAFVNVRRVTNYLEKIGKLN